MSSDGNGIPQTNLYACCFCGEPEGQPAMIEVVFNWGIAVAVSDEPFEPVHQAWFAHPECLVDALDPSVREFAPEVEEFLRRDGSYRSGAYE